MNNSIIYALDFDGVICDSMMETAITGWKAAGSLWGDMPEAIPQEMIDRFRLVRPIIETGYEAILAMRLLYQGETVAAIYSSYSGKIPILLKDAHVTVDDLKKLFGETRDEWIKNDLGGWIENNSLFAGVAEKLQKLGRDRPWYVVTTKQERFVKQILQANGIGLADERIFGLERDKSKVEILKGLLEVHPEETIHFVEDRLPALLHVLKTADLASVNPIFALWGYNTSEDKMLAAQHAISLQRLDEFLES